MEVQIRCDKMNYWWVCGCIYSIHDDVGEDLKKFGYSKGKATEKEIEEYFGNKNNI